MFDLAKEFASKEINPYRNQSGDTLHFTSGLACCGGEGTGSHIAQEQICRKSLETLFRYLCRGNVSQCTHGCDQVAATATSSASLGDGLCKVCSSASSFSMHFCTLTHSQPS